MAKPIPAYPLFKPPGGTIPSIGLGTFAIDDEVNVRSTLHAAIDAGYRHIDTAFTHTGERYMGPVLEEIFAKGVVKREDLFITGRLPMNGLRPENVKTFMMATLEFLKVKYLDLYLISCPIATQKIGSNDNIVPLDANKNALMDRDIELVQTWKAMELLVDEKLTKAIGLSNFNSEQVRRIWNQAIHKPVCLQVECHAYFNQENLLSFCNELKIVMIAYAPLGSPEFPQYVKRIMGADVPDEAKVLEDAKLVPIGEKHCKTPAQVLLRYLHQRGIVVIPKSVNPERLRENIDIFNFNLDTEDMKVLKSMDRGLRYFRLNLHPGMNTHPEYPFNKVE